MAADGRTTQLLFCSGIFFVVCGWGAGQKQQQINPQSTQIMTVKPTKIDRATTSRASHRKYISSPSRIGQRERHVGKWGPTGSYHHQHKSFPSSSSSSSTFMRSSTLRSPSPSSYTNPRNDEHYDALNGASGSAGMSGGSNMPPSVLAGFFFKRRTERLDWRMLASLQLDQIQRDVSLY